MSNVPPRHLHLWCLVGLGICYGIKENFATEVLLLLARKILSVKRHLAVTNVSNHWYSHNGA